MKIRYGIICAAAAAAALGLAATSQAEAPKGPARFTADGKMEFPKDYRTWVYLTTGMDMSYTEGPAPSAHAFDSVFVNREAYDGFLKTGHWPDKTVFVLEVRRAQNRGSINKNGFFQTARAGMEVHVKDEARFKDSGGWAFFGGFAAEGPGNKIPTGAGCIACHEKHGAVDTTFVQFYPTLVPVAQAKATFSPAYLKEAAAEGAAK